MAFGRIAPKIKNPRLTVGNLSPLFTTTVKNARINPAVSFSLTPSFSTAGFVTSSGSALSSGPLTFALPVTIIGTINNGTIPLCTYVPFGCTVTYVRQISTTSGTLTADFEIGSTSIGGLSSISVSSTAQDVAASSPNSVSSGNALNLVISGVSSASGLQFTLVCTRTS